MSTIISLTFDLLTIAAIFAAIIQYTCKHCSDRLCKFEPLTSVRLHTLIFMMFVIRLKHCSTNEFEFEN